MHRVILGITDSKIHGDHKDHNGLNNQRNNLRIATRTQNNCNVTKRPISSSKYLGVSIKKGGNKYDARICVNKKQVWIGCFDTEIQAALAYNEAAIKYHGEFANPNKF